MMSKRSILKDFLAYEKLLYIRFTKLTSEDEILSKSFDELGVKDDFSYKIEYFLDDDFTHVFLTQRENVSSKDFLIPEPLLFGVYFNKAESLNNLVLLFKKQYIVLIDYVGSDFKNCKILPLNAYNETYQAKLQNIYENIISIDDTKNISIFRKLESKLLYPKLLEEISFTKINFAKKESLVYFKSYSFKALLLFFCGVFLAMMYPSYLYIQALSNTKENFQLKSLIQNESEKLKHLQLQQKTNEVILKTQNENQKKIKSLQKIYSHTLCYRDFYNFLSVLNFYQIPIEALSIKDNIFTIELIKDDDFYDEFKKYSFILKNKEVKHGKTILVFEKNL